jgi:hypothetical protein
MDNWTYEGYCNTVLGSTSASEIVREYKLEKQGISDISTFLAVAEIQAVNECRLKNEPIEWAQYRERTVQALFSASK